MPRFEDRSVLPELARERDQHMAEFGVELMEIEMQRRRSDIDPFNRTLLDIDYATVSFVRMAYEVHHTYQLMEAIGDGIDDLDDDQFTERLRDSVGALIRMQPDVRDMGIDTDTILEQFDLVQYKIIDHK